MNKRKIYVASSWRNFDRVKEVVKTLRALNHEVFDFTEIPFNYEAVDANWQKWTPRQYVNSFTLDSVKAGFDRDRAALEWCDTVLLVLPSGRSAHLEAGFVAGAGKEAYCFMPLPQEPELMYGVFKEIILDVSRLKEVFKTP